MTGVAYVRALADQYMREQGIAPRPLAGKFPADPDYGYGTAMAYDNLPEFDSCCLPAYAAFVNETNEQWRLITQQSGIAIVVTLDDPYPNSAAMVDEVRAGRLRVYGGDAQHPVMSEAENIRFRAVHDLFAHAAEGNQFGPKGELNAAIRHAAMYTPLARLALLTETHGQNSWVNYHPAAAENRLRPGSVYATQKAALLPLSITREFMRRYL